MRKVTNEEVLATIKLPMKLEAMVLTKAVKLWSCGKKLGQCRKILLMFGRTEGTRRGRRLM